MKYSESHYGVDDWRSWRKLPRPGQAILGRQWISMVRHRCLTINLICNRVAACWQQGIFRRVLAVASSVQRAVLLCLSTARLGFYLPRSSDSCHSCQVWTANANMYPDRGASSSHARQAPLGVRAMKAPLCPSHRARTNR